MPVRLAQGARLPLQEEEGHPLKGGYDFGGEFGNGSPRGDVGWDIFEVRGKWSANGSGLGHRNLAQPDQELISLLRQGWKILRLQPKGLGQQITRDEAEGIGEVEMLGIFVREGGNDVKVR